MSIDELLPVVDENDHVIGQRPRSEIHQLGLVHRSVHILVFNDQQQLFLQKRSTNKDINPGLWDSSAAGHVDVGESYTQCAEREITEELGIRIHIPLHFLFKLPASVATGMEFVHVYRYQANGPFQLATDEIEYGDWFNQLQVDQQVNNNDPMLTGTFRLIWSTYCSTDIGEDGKDGHYAN